jgi:hypothetical protein
VLHPENANRACDTEPLAQEGGTFRFDIRLGEQDHASTHHRSRRSHGAQGGGLVNAILADASGGFRARALTRKPDGDTGRALTRRGADVVQADLADPASLTKAFAGADALFCITNFWEHFSGEREQAQARAMAAAAKAAGVSHVVWSTLEDTRKWVPLTDDRMPTLQGKHKVPHFDGKGDSDQFFRDAGVPPTFLLTSFYWEDFISFGAGPKPGPDGQVLLTLPMDDMPLSGSRWRISGMWRTPSSGRGSRSSARRWA